MVGQTFELKKIKFKEIIFSLYKRIQLSSFENITEDEIVFHSAKKHKVPNSKIKYQRIKIERKLPNGKLTPLVVETPFLFSFGISERKDQETNKISGYSIPVCLWKKDAEPNQKETNFLNIINKVQDLCRDHLSRDYGENEAACLSDILYYKQIEYTDGKGKTKKKKDKTSAPVLYVKLIYSSDTKKFSTIFRVKGNKEVKPLDYKDKYFNTRMAIIFDSIYLGKTSISIQVKAHEVHILPFEERKSILEYKENDEDENDENDDEDDEVESDQEEDKYYENEEEIED